MNELQKILIFKLKNHYALKAQNSTLLRKRVAGPFAFVIKF
jgi:hypothetical protein